MNKISEQLLEAMEIMANASVSLLLYDKTILAKIYSIVNLDTGEYKVRYEGNIFSAYSDDVDKTYKVGDDVYVMVPEGDFSNRKLITSLVSALSLSSTLLTLMQNTIIPVSPSLLDMYPDISEPPYGVIAGVLLNYPGLTCWIYRGPERYDPSDFHGLFLQYAQQYENIRISGSFITRFHCVHDKGNYGIEVGFYTQDNTVVNYRLDLNSFNGDPYSFTVAAPQSVVIKSPKGYLLGLKYIKLFEEGFVPDRIIENGVVTDKENLTQPNIFVKDVSVDFVEVRDMSDASYYLTISAPRGIAFSSTISSLDLVGRLLFQGRDLMSDKTCQCEWYERDLSVMIGDEEYNKNAGFGWRPIGNTSSTVSLVASDVAHQLLYKLLVVYNESVSLSAEITIYNHMSGYDFHIEQVTLDADIILRISDETLVGDWYIEYPDGSYTRLSKKDNPVNSVAISQYLKYSSVVFHCCVYAPDRIYLASLSHTIVNSESEGDLTIQYIGEDSFRYDANGDIAIEDSERDRTLLVNLAWKEGVGTSYNVTWVMRDYNSREIELPRSKEEAYDPPDSMIMGLWVDSYNILHYNIKLKYKVNYLNNSVFVKIQTMSGETYLFEKEILFLKDGDQGTNGTTYVTAIRPCDSNGNKLSGLHPIVYNQGWGQPLDIRCYVYKDGELINNDSNNYRLVFLWTGVNVNITGEDSLVAVNGAPDLREEYTTADLEFYVKVQVTIYERLHDNKRIDIYASYPIDMAMNGINYSLIDISTIPSYVKYTASGLSPSFYSNNIDYLYDGSSYDDLIESLNTNVLTIRDDRDGNRYIEPASEFIFDDIKNNSESNIGVLEMRDPSSDARFLIHPIIFYLDTYGNEAINGWDGTALDTGNGEYVFAPLVGAGTKDSANRFTGVVMGKDSGQDKVGLYGYQSGVNTFGLMENGTAFFGAKSGGGLILIDGRSATIKGGNGGDDSSGMTITLADIDADGETEAIKIGGGTFSVNYKGEVTANEAHINGSIYARDGRIGCDERENGGWEITSNRISSGIGDNTVALDSSDEWYAIWAGKRDAGTAYDPTTRTITSPAKFVVTKDGFVYAENARVKGVIEADSGKVGGWIIGENTLESSRAGIDGVVGMASSGLAAFWVGQGLSQDTDTPEGHTQDNSYFLVTRQGKLYCKSADVRGAITADSGSIGSWLIRNGGLSTADGNIRITPTLFKFNDYFTVNSSGATISGSITASKGRIGGWTINESTLTSGTTTLNGADGSITCYAGYIGGWEISDDAITGYRTLLDSSGNIQTDSVDIWHLRSGRFSRDEQLGTLGYVAGEAPDHTSTYNIGIATTGTRAVILLSGSGSIGIRTGSAGNLGGGGGVFIDGNRVSIDAHNSTLALAGRTITFTVNGRSVYYVTNDDISDIYSELSDLDRRVTSLENAPSGGGGSGE